MNNIAKAEATINAPITEVWNALTDPDIIKEYMFGATVISDWKGHLNKLVDNLLTFNS